jgi:hypothetical protein
LEGTLKRAAEVEAAHGEGWAAEWLGEAGAAEAAAWIRNRFYMGGSDEAEL